jgi:hypothetical protein
MPQMGKCPGPEKRRERGGAAGAENRELGMQQVRSDVADCRAVGAWGGGAGWRSHMMRWIGVLLVRSASFGLGLSEIKLYYF